MGCEFFRHRDRHLWRLALRRFLGFQEAMARSDSVPTLDEDGELSAVIHHLHEVPRVK